MKPNRFAVLALAVLLGGCEKKRTSVVEGFTPGPPPEELQSGEAAFNQRCASCHGSQAIGTASGPPLVHIIYEPSHHADEAFRRAITLGVVPHHWSFGRMPPVPDLSPEDVEAIIRYVRWLQQKGGIN